VFQRWNGLLPNYKVFPTLQTPSPVRLVVLATRKTLDDEELRGAAEDLLATYFTPCRLNFVFDSLTSVRQQRGHNLRQGRIVDLYVEATEWLPCFEPT
jgi:hypothetical protein